MKRWLVGCVLCHMCHRQRGHLEMAYIKRDSI